MKVRHALLLMVLLFLLTGCTGVAPRPFSAGRDVLFFDDFVVGQTGNWHTEGDELGQTAVRDEKLIIELNSPNMLQFSTLKEPIFDNFILEVEATLLAGPVNGSYGLLFRMMGPNQFYRFEITGDGKYLVERRDSDATWARLMPDWAESAAIRPGIDSTNRLKVVAVGSALAFYVNDELLHRVQDSSYPQGNIALDAGTFGQGGLRVAFDNVVVRQP